MGLPNPAEMSYDANWPLEIAAAVLPFMTATAKFYDPTSATPTEAVLTSAARAQPFRLQTDASTETNWANKRLVRLQLPLDATTGIIEQGWACQLEGCADPTLNMVTLIVVSAINSSHAAIRTVICETSMNETARIGVG